jgi:hypothetical protein
MLTVYRAQKEEEEKKKVEEERKKKISDLWARMRSKQLAPTSSTASPSSASVSTQPEIQTQLVLPPPTSSAASSSPISVPPQPERQPERQPETQVISPTSPDSSTAPNTTPSCPPRINADKTTQTEIFDFAGETIIVPKDIPENESLSGSKRKRVPPKNNLEELVANITGKKKKMSTFTKTKLDWTHYKETEGKDKVHEMEQHKKNGYLEKMAFLSRVEERTIEQERSLRKGRKKPT